MNWKLKFAILEKYGRQVNFARDVGSTEQRLCKIITGRCSSTSQEKKIFGEKLGIPESEIFPGN